ncbi:MAG: murein biosynthesis integral membrane protein MurJ, partial [Proteobacteria bacterium]|nr:murein biosynthesis integral membrane protein MurJ [Pseudomonadota bacterium]
MQHKNNQENPSDSRKPSPAGAGLVGSAAAMAMGTLTSRVLGLFRDVAFAALFSKTVTDAWTVAFRIPNLFRRLLGEGSLAVSFVPVFIEAREGDSSGVRSQNLVNSFYTLLLLLLTLITVLGIAFSEPIVRLITDPTYAEIPGKLDLTIKMTRIMFVFIFLISTYAFFMGILNALGSFALPAFGPALWNVCLILGIYFPKEWQGFEGQAMAWSVVIGGIVQAGFLVPALIRRGYLPKIHWNWSNLDSQKVLQKMGPGILGTAVLQITTLMNTYFASSLGEGANSYFYYADRLLEFPLSIVSVSLGTALLPTLSTLWVQNRKEEMIATANRFFRINLFIGFSAAAGLYLLARPLVELMFERGRFDSHDSMITAQILAVASLTLVVSSGVRVFVPIFYALGDTKFPAKISSICVAVHIVLAYVLVDLFQFQGLAAATVLTATLNLGLLFWGFRRKVGAFGFSQVLKSLGQFSVPLVLMSVFLLQYPF